MYHRFVSVGIGESAANGNVMFGCDGDAVSTVLQRCRVGIDDIELDRGCHYDQDGKAENDEAEKREGRSSYKMDIFRAPIAFFNIQFQGLPLIS